MIDLWFAGFKRKKKSGQSEDKSENEKKKTHTVIGRKIQIPNGIP